MRAVLKARPLDLTVLSSSTIFAVDYSQWSICHSELTHNGPRLALSDDAAMPLIALVGLSHCLETL